MMASETETATKSFDGTQTDMDLNTNTTDAVNATMDDKKDGALSDDDGNGMESTNTQRL